MKIDYEEKLDFSDVLLRPKRSMLTSKNDVSLERTYKFLHSRRTWTGTGIMASNMDGVGTFSMALQLQKYNMITILKKDYTLNDWSTWLGGDHQIDPKNIGVSMGTGVFFNPLSEDFEHAKKILEAHPKVNFIVVDVANGYLESSVGALRIVRDQFPEHIIACGNVATLEMAEELVFNGADIVKVGIGPGSVCTTRIKSGVGVPQLSAIMDCSDVHGIGGHIIGDGGCTNPGDIAKALGAGADFVMLGSMLAAHDVCEETITGLDSKEFDSTEFAPSLRWTGPWKTSKKSPNVSSEVFVEFYGMSSEAARERHGGRKDGYRSAEGRVVRLPYRGPIVPTIEDILGGLTSAMVYVGAKKIKDMPKCTTFSRVRNTHSRWLQQFDVDKKYD